MTIILWSAPLVLFLGTNKRQGFKTFDQVEQESVGSYLKEFQNNNSASVSFYVIFGYYRLVIIVLAFIRLGKGFI